VVDPVVARDNVLLTSWAVRLQGERLLERSSRGDSQGLEITLMRSEQWLFCVALGEFLKACDVAKRQKDQDPAVVAACREIAKKIPAGKDLRNLTIHYNDPRRRLKALQETPGMSPGLGLEFIRPMAGGPTLGMFVRIGKVSVEVREVLHHVEEFAKQLQGRW
jgi:hypothetical protein